MGPMDAYTDQEADRLSNIMANDPHFAANELRNQLQQLDPQSASVLISKTKYDESAKATAYGPGLGDLQIQPELDQNGYDTGWRNVTMATPDSVEQIAEIQARAPQYGQYGYVPGGGYGSATLGFAAGIIVGDLLWNQQRGIDFNDDRYRGWCNREQSRENYWNNPQNLQNYQNNWSDPNYRAQFQTQQNWQNVNQSSHVNNSYVTNNRYDTTVINKPVNTTIINETINNSKQTTINAPHTTIMNNIRQNNTTNNTRTDVHTTINPASGRPAQQGGGEHVQWQAPAPGRTNTGTVPVERTQPTAQPTQHAPERQQQQGPTAAQQAEQARETAAANQARETAANQARETAANQARETAANQARENAANQARENAANQARENAANQARENAQRQQTQAPRQTEPSHPAAPAPHEAAPPAAKWPPAKPTK